MKMLTHVRTNILILLVKLMVATALQQIEEAKETSGQQQQNHSSNYMPGNAKGNNMNPSPLRLDPRVLQDETYGDNAAANAYPFFANTQGTTPLCAATLIHPDILMTSAQCAYTFKDVQIGEVSIASGATLDLGIVDIFEDFNFVTNLHDIMLVQLLEPSDKPVVQYNEGSDPLVGAGLTVIGFGANSNRLKEFRLRHEVCGNEADSTTQMCAGNFGNNKICGGDTGGPVFNRVGVQVGIISFTTDGCTPDVFTRVSAYTQWIRDTICHLSAFPPEYCFPSMSPTTSPTVSSKPSISHQPTRHPTKHPTHKPTIPATYLPTHYPSESPSDAPTPKANLLPTAYPSDAPSISFEPSSSPSKVPTPAPTNKPSPYPTKDLTGPQRRFKFFLRKITPFRLLPGRAGANENP